MLGQLTGHAQSIVAVSLRYRQGWVSERTEKGHHAESMLCQQCHIITSPPTHAPPTRTSTSPSLTSLHDLHQLDELVHVLPCSQEALKHEALEVLVHVCIQSSHHLQHTRTCNSLHVTPRATALWTIAGPKYFGSVVHTSMGKWLLL